MMRQSKAMQDAVAEALRRQQAARDWAERNSEEYNRKLGLDYDSYARDFAREEREQQRRSG